MKSTIVGVAIAVIVVVAAIAGIVSYYHTNNAKTTTSSNISSTSSMNSTQNSPRIVSLAPSDTQVLIALGLGKYIVGMDKWSYQLLQYLNLTNEVPENVTIFNSIINPNISGILLLHPTVVIVEWGLDAKYIPEMEKLGLNVLATNSDYAYSFSQIEDNIMKVAAYFNVTSKGEKLVNWMNQKIAEFSSTGNTTVAYIAYINPNLDFWTAGGNVFINNIIVSAGGINVFSNLPKYPVVSPSQLLLANPQVIIAGEMGQNYTYVMSKISSMPGIQNVTAYKEGRIYFLSGLAPNLMNEPGPLSVYAIKLVHEIIVGATPNYITTTWVKQNLNVTLPIFK